MKTIHTITTLFIVSLLLASCTVSNMPYAYDDLYYSPSADPVQQARIDPNSNGQENYQSQSNIPSDRYNQDSGTNPNSAQYQNNYAAEGEAQPNQETNEVEYYDEDYAQTLQTINAPVRSFNTYDPYQRDRILYTQNPVFMSPSVYGGYQFWDPFVPSTGLSVGWNSFNGWNVGVNAGFGFGCGGGLNPYGRFYDPFWAYNWGYDPFFGPTHGFNNWAYQPWNNPWNNPWGWNNGFNNFAFQNGYRQGFNDGNFSNYRNYAIGNNGSNPVRQISTPRGRSGSVNVRSSGDRPVRPERNETIRTNTPNQTQGTSRPVRPVQSATERPSTESRPTNNRPVRSTTTPPRYQRPTTPATNARPTQESRPTRTVPTRPSTTTRPSAAPQRPTYSRPTQQKVRPRNSRPATRPAPTYTRPATTPQPRQQSRPSYNNSRPTYSAPRSTGGSRSSGGSRSAPTRPSRR